MIINHRYKFIFIKTMKTAGTSVELFLNRFCDSGDVVTKIDNTEGIPFNYYNQGNFQNHCPIGYVKKNIDKDIFNSYYKFTIVRNPYDQIVSKFHFRLKWSKNDITSGSGFKIQAKLTKRNIGNWSMYTINNIPVMDYYIKFENLINDVDSVCKILKLPCDEKLNIFTKHKFRKNKNYKDMYTGVNFSVKDIVSTYAKNEIDYFGYNF